MSSASAERCDKPMKRNHQGDHGTRKRTSGPLRDEANLLESCAPEVACLAVTASLFQSNLFLTCKSHQDNSVAHGVEWEGGMGPMNTELTRGQ